MKNIFIRGLIFLKLQQAKKVNEEFLNVHTNSQERRAKGIIIKVEERKKFSLWIIVIALNEGFLVHSLAVSIPIMKFSTAL